MKALFIQVPMEMNPQTKIWGHVFDFGGSPGKPGKWQKEVEATNIRDILKESPPRGKWGPVQLKNNRSQSRPLGSELPIRGGGVHGNWDSHKPTPFGP